MQTLSISTAKAKLSELVDTAERTQEEYAITVNGSPMAILVGISEWESLKETIYWLAQPEITNDVDRARDELAAKDGLAEEAIRSRYRVPRRVRQ